MAAKESGFWLGGWFKADPEGKNYLQQQKQRIETKLSFLEESTKQVIIYAIPIFGVLCQLDMEQKIQADLLSKSGEDLKKKRIELLNSKHCSIVAAILQIALFILFSPVFPVLITPLLFVSVAILVFNLIEYHQVKVNLHMLSRQSRS